MEKGNNPLYDKNTLEFVAVAFECCSWLEKTEREGADLFAFVDKATKLLPLLYLKATLLPEVGGGGGRAAAMPSMKTSTSHLSSPKRLTRRCAPDSPLCSDNTIATSKPSCPTCDTATLPSQLLSPKTSPTSTKTSAISSRSSERNMSPRCTPHWRAARKTSASIGAKRYSTP